jgi:high-affinity Fe2+/Pb2+ permease
MAGQQQVAQLRRWEWYWWVAGIGLALVVGAMIWQGVVSAGVPDPFATNLNPSAVVINTSLIVFREGLEAILVLAAITASFVGAQAHLRRAVFQGAGWAMVASIVTWFIVVAIMNSNQRTCFAHPSRYGVVGDCGVVGDYELVFAQCLIWTGLDFAPQSAQT